MPRAKSGPVPKARRHQFTLRLPEEHYGLYEQAARQQGLSVGDYLAARLAEAHGLPVPDYVDRWRRKDVDAMAS
jgi:hypothetical protein